ncbi:MAG: AfsR/SARP family transcriptional regulator [Candidatus Baltobacteraceae bacterium]
MENLLLQVRSAAAKLGSVGRWMLLFEHAEVLEDGVFAEFLAQAVQKLEGGTIAITSARAPPPAVLHALPDGEVAVFLRSDLALNVQQIAPYREFSELDASTLFCIAAIASGWSAPMEMMARRLSGHENSVDLFDARNDMWSEIFDWLTSRVLDPLPADIRSALIAAVTFGDLGVEDFGDFDGRESRIANLICREYQLAKIDNGIVRVLPVLALCIFERYGAEMKEAADSILGATGSLREELRAIRSCVTTGRFSDAEHIVRERHLLHLSEYPYPGLVLEYMLRSTLDLSSFPNLWLALLPARRAFRSPQQLLEEARLAVAAAPPNPLLRSFLLGTVGLLLAESGELDGAREVLANLREDRGGRIFGEAVALVIALEERSWEKALEYYRKVRATIARYPAWFVYFQSILSRAEVQRALGSEGAFSAFRSAIADRFVPLSYADASSTVNALIVSWLQGDDHAANLAKAMLLRQLFHGASPTHWRIAAAFDGIDLGATKWTDPRDDAFSAMLLAERSSAFEDRRRYLERAAAIAHASGLVRIGIAVAVASAVAKPELSAALTTKAAAFAESEGCAELKAGLDELATGEFQRLPAVLDVLVGRFGGVHRCERDPDDSLFVDIVHGSVSSNDGSPVVVSERTLALVALIVTEGGKLRRERAIDILWPDLDGDAGANAFKAALHRAREQLGDSAAIQLCNGVLSFGPSVRSNYQRLMALAAEADPLRDAESMSTILQAVASESWEWAPWEWFGERIERIKSAAREIGLALGAAQGVAGDWVGVVATARATIEIDPLDEVPRAMLVRAYRAMGNDPLAVAEIRNYEKLLKTELGIALPENLRALAGSGV